MTAPGVSQGAAVGRPLRIGCGAGFANDRIDAAVRLVEGGNLDVLVLECLAERTIALGQTRELATPGTGYDPTLERRLRALLGVLSETGCRLVTNLGSANPRAAGLVTQRVAQGMGLPLRIAVVTGDDVLEQLDQQSPAWEDGKSLREHGQVVSANAYLGVEALLPALETGADVVLTGRVADPSLFLAPMVNAFGWGAADWELLGAGTVVGHLLECGSQVSGGYFVDPPHKTVENLAYVGFPLAEVHADGTAVITKVEGTGGAVTFETVSEQLTYEILDPGRYLTPDVTADLRCTRLDDVGLDRVRVSGVGGTSRPERLKVSVGYRAGFRCEAGISYAGEGAEGRARAAAEVVRARVGDVRGEVRLDIVGIDSLHGPALSTGGAPHECRLRASVLSEDVESAVLMGEEVIGLYNNGPAGGGGARSAVTEVIGVLSTDIARTGVHPVVTVLQATP